jgi:hypothetical protein
LLLHLPNNHGADDVRNAMVEAMSRPPQTLRRTLTWDQGQEMANHMAIAKAAQLKIYFRDPHSPWQRATNENTNGLLRQYFPKSTDLSGYHRDCLEFVAAQLINRPASDSAGALRQKRWTSYSPTRQPARCCVDRLNPPLQDGFVRRARPVDASPPSPRLPAC